MGELADEETRTEDETRTERDSTGAAENLFRCFWCERIHQGRHPLAVCPTCRARLSTMRLPGMRGSYRLNDAAIDEAAFETDGRNDLDFGGSRVLDNPSSSRSHPETTR